VVICNSVGFDTSDTEAAVEDTFDENLVLNKNSQPTLKTAAAVKSPQKSAKQFTKRKSSSPRSKSSPRSSALDSSPATGPARRTIQRNQAAISPTKRKLPLNPSSSEIIDELREKFQHLNMLRTTAAEALLEEYKKSSEDRIKAAERVIDGLRKENESLRKRSENSNPVRSSRVSDVSTLSVDQASGLRPIVDLYGKLTGLEVAADSETLNLWHCSISGRQGGNPIYFCSFCKILRSICRWTRVMINTATFRRFRQNHQSPLACRHIFRRKLFLIQISCNFSFGVLLTF
jgi:hypothetical protein